MKKKKDSELKYYKMLFDTFFEQAKLSDNEVANILKSEYINLNTIRGDSKLPCLFPNCNSIGVERSHLFSKGFLRTLSENGKFYTKSFFPEFTIENPHFRIEEIGISKAMTFPGFCSVCEKKFPFERNLRFSEANDYFLQLFRTVCYDKRILEIEIEKNKQIIKKIIGFSTKKIRPFFNKKGLELQFVSGTNLMENFLEKQNREILKELKKVDILYQKFIGAYNETEAMKIVVIGLKRSLPFFAGYLGNIRLRIRRKTIDTNFVLNIHPITVDEAIIFFTDFSKKLNENIFKSFNDDDFIGFFSEILACSNSWICKKSYWHLLSEETRFEVLRNRKLKIHSDSKVTFATGYQKD